MSDHTFVEGTNKRSDGAPLCMVCGQSGSHHRRASHPGRCDWCGGRHRAVDCAGWDGR